MRSFLIPLFCLFFVSPRDTTAETFARDRSINAEFTIIVAQDVAVRFKVAPEKTPIACVGMFANTDGNFDGTFPGSVRVKFGAAAAGRSNLCTIALTRAGGPGGQPPATKTIVLHVIVPKVVSRTLAHVPGSSDDRSTVGVGEEVMMTLEPRECLLDSDVTWSVDNSSAALSHRTGLGTIYQGGFPKKTAANYRKFIANQGSDQITPFIKDATDDVTLSFGDVSPEHRKHLSADKWRNYDIIARDHSAAALAAAYTVKLNGIDRQLATHRWSTVPVMVPFPPAEKSYTHFFVRAKGFGPALVTVATLQSHLADGADQPEDLRAREIRLVARIVAMFHQAVDPAFATEPCPNQWDVQPPAGATSRRGIVVGMLDPEDVEEPDLRRQYRHAIAANDAKITAWNKQSRADRDDATMQRFAYSYLEEICGGSDPRLKRYRQALITCGIDERTAREFSKKPRN